MSKADELKPCPFCGGKAEIRVGEYASFVEGYAVGCSNCALTFGASGRIGEAYCWSCCYETEAEAIEAWNRRPGCGGCRRKNEPNRAYICRHCSRMWLYKDMYEPKDNDEEED